MHGRGWFPPHWVHRRVEQLMRTPFTVNLAVAFVLMALASDAVVAESDCKARLKQQEEECRALAERRQELCPSGGSAECQKLSEQIAGKCTHNPCGGASRGGASRGGASKGSRPKGKGPRSKPKKK